MGGDDPAPPTPTFEPERRPSPAYGLPCGNLVAGVQAGGKGAGLASRRVRRAVRSGGARVTHLTRLAAVGLGLALGALQQYVPSPLAKVYEVCF